MALCFGGRVSFGDASTTENPQLNYFYFFKRPTIVVFSLKDHKCMFVEKNETSDICAVRFLIATSFTNIENQNCVSICKNRC